MMQALYFIRHFHTFMKFYFTNWRRRLWGYRRFKFSLHIEQKNKKGETTGMKLHQKDIIIKADYFDTERVASIPIPDNWHERFESMYEYQEYQLPFIILRDEHHSVFELCDHLTWKEII